MSIQEGTTAGSAPILPPAAAAPQPPAAAAAPSALPTSSPPIPESNFSTSEPPPKTVTGLEPPPNFAVDNSPYVPTTSFKSTGQELTAPTTAGSGLELQMSSAPVLSADPTAPMPAPARTPTPVPAQAPAAIARPATVAAKRRAAPAAKPELILWRTDQLKQAADPLARGVCRLLEIGAAGAAFLSISAPAPGQAVPQFTATAAINPGDKQSLWTGMKWNAALIPEVWNAFLRAGWVEFAPPGAVTNHQSSRNVLRGAFGVSAEEWLLLVRCGPPTACRGVLAIVSAKSLSAEMAEAIALISQPLPAAQAA